MPSASTKNKLTPELLNVAVYAFVVCLELGLPPGSLARFEELLDNSLCASVLLLVLEAFKSSEVAFTSVFKFWDGKLCKDRGVLGCDAVGSLAK